MSQTQAIDRKSLEGRKFRFIVSSAQDAANIIRERLGEKAEVLSVKQISPKGFSRFLSSPQLEIIVTLPKSQENIAPESKKEEPIPSKREIIKTEEKPTSKPISYVMEKSGFDPNFIQYFKSTPEWEDINQLPIQHALAEISMTLKSHCNKLTSTPLTTRTAFFGTPASGTSSALCKQLVSDVFLNKKSPVVVKIESEKPNSNDTLRIFCELIGLPLLSETDEIPNDSELSPLYFDVQASNLSDAQHWQDIKNRLDQLEISSRVLVLNAAYDPDLIKSSLHLGQKLGATHLVFSHVDEIQSTSKLWPFVLLSNLPILFLSSGQDLTSDVIHDVPEFLLQHSFPSIVLN